MKNPTDIKSEYDIIDDEYYLMDIEIVDFNDMRMISQVYDISGFSPSLPYTDISISLVNSYYEGYY